MMGHGVILKTAVFSISLTVWSQLLYYGCYIQRHFSNVVDVLLAISHN